MITEKEILIDIEVLKSRYAAVKPETRERNAITKKLKIAKQNLEYIRRNPSHQFVEQELSKLERRLKSIDEWFMEWQKCQTEIYKNPSAKYRSEVDRPKVVNQINNLRYLIGG